MSFFSKALGVSGLTNMIGLTSGLEAFGNDMLNNYYSKKNTKKAYERDIAFWNMQNEYNSPANQMQRLKDAGLNPNLIYGQINSGNAAGSVHSGIANQSFKVNPLDDILNTTSKLLALKQQNQQNKLLDTQNLEVVNRVKMQNTEAKMRKAELARFLHDNEIILKSGMPSTSDPVDKYIMYYVMKFLGGDKEPDKEPEPMKWTEGPTYYKGTRVNPDGTQVLRLRRK